MVWRVCEELAAALSGLVRFAAVQGEAPAEQLPKLNTWELPTVLILQDGKPECKFIGLRESRFTVTVQTDLRSKCSMDV